jgi:hypothetical protein
MALMRLVRWVGGLALRVNDGRSLEEELRFGREVWEFEPYNEVRSPEIKLA